MATTGVPNQLYQGTDAPDLVDGAFATHTHDYSGPEIKTRRKNQQYSGTVSANTNDFIKIDFSDIAGHTIIGIITIKPSAGEVSVMSYRTSGTTVTVNFISSIAISSALFFEVTVSYI